jgi:PBP1b-binding outer membrane lipoprotein LpoB
MKIIIGLMICAALLMSCGEATKQTVKKADDCLFKNFWCSEAK